MYRAFTYGNGKFLQKFQDEDLDKLQLKIKYWFEVRRNDQSTEFHVTSDEKLLKTLTNEHFQ